VDAAEIQRALDDVFDQALVFHAYTDYMRDYELVVQAVADPRTGIPPAYLRYLFRYCVESDVRSSVSLPGWSESLDDRLISFETGRDMDGYVWGVKWQVLYPGGRVVEGSTRASIWSESMGIDFHEIRVESNAHTITLVASDLEVTEIDPGYSPFTVQAES